MSRSSDDEPPRPDANDRAYGLAKTVIAAVPIVGSPAVELLNTLVTPALESRRDMWFASLATRLSSLEQAVLDGLAVDPEFVDTVLQASQAALRTRHEVKRDALRNAVMNAARSSAPEGDLQELFIGFVDSFSPWHLLLLSFIGKNPADRDARMHEASRVNKPLRELIEEQFPELRGGSSTYQHFLSDLQARGLLVVPARGGHVLDIPWSLVAISGLGTAFLRFVSEPTAEVSGAA
jgi:hypothetical protein